MLGFGEDWLASRAQLLIPLWLSLSVHEWAHAWSAWRLGDDTAAREGRLTLNPLEHIDPIGTFLFPLLGAPFGWAKPVPISPARFHPGVSMRAGLVLTAAAGPVSNLVLALLATLALGLLTRLQPESAVVGAGVVASGGLAQLLHTTILLNVVLAVFNAIPIPPLDGSRVVDGLLPDGLRPAWNGFSRLAPLALACVIVLPLLLGASPFELPLRLTQALVEAMLAVLAG